jgi:hypothetical protein
MVVGATGAVSSSIQISRISKVISPVCYRALSTSKAKGKWKVGMWGENLEFRNGRHFEYHLRIGSALG